MIWITRILIFIASIAILLGVLYAALSIYGWDKIWTKAVGPADMGSVDFSTLRKSKKPNQVLVCPADMCRDKDRDWISQSYALSASDLRDELLNSIKGEKRLERVDDNSQPLELRFVQRSERLKFPDTISIEFFPLTDSTSTLALYSRSLVGETDFGVNLARAKRWLKRLEQKETR